MKCVVFISLRGADRETFQLLVVARVHQLTEDITVVTNDFDVSYYVRVGVPIPMRSMHLV